MKNDIRDDAVNQMITEIEEEKTQLGKEENVNQVKAKLSGVEEQKPDKEKVDGQIFGELRGTYRLNRVQKPEIKEEAEVSKLELVQTTEPISERRRRLDLQEKLKRSLKMPEQKPAETLKPVETFKSKEIRLKREGKRRRRYD